MENKCWYKEMAVYQIWCRSFCDGNGDGIGDLWGVLGKLDYIKSLNVDAIWFSPLYPSPNADFGYDISDYRNIHPDFGNLEVFRQVLDGAHERGLRVFMDLVVNHTSDEHPWFIESKKGKDNPYHDYYYWRKGRGKRPPNNWDSLFEGGAWEYDENLDEWYGYMSHYPDTWINGYDADLIIRADRIYYLRAIPSIYILDGEKRIVCKDATLETALQILNL